MNSPPKDGLMLIGNEFNIMSEAYRASSPNNRANKMPIDVNHSSYGSRKQSQIVSKT